MAPFVAFLTIVIDGQVVDFVCLAAVGGGFESQAGSASCVPKWLHARVVKTAVDGKGKESGTYLGTVPN